MAAKLAIGDRVITPDMGEGSVLHISKSKVAVSLFRPEAPRGARNTVREYHPSWIVKVGG